MKKQIVSAAALILMALSIPCTAQINLGILGGVNVASLSNNKAEWTMYSKTSWGAGVLVEIGFTPNLSLVSTPMLLKKGGKAIEGPTHYEFHNSYLELPVLVKVGFGNTVRPYVLAGPSIGYLVKATLGGWSGADKLEADMDPVTEKWDLGLAVGGGLSVAAGNVILFIEGRYAFSFTDASKGGNVEIKAGSTTMPGTMLDEHELKNRGIHIMAGLSIPVKK
jgi:opacity protein-like surface antigen